MSLDSVIDEIIQFRDDRDWAQFHGVRNLMAALSIEVAELQETVLWKTDDQIDELLQSDEKNRICEELADVFIYALLLAHKLDEHPLAIIKKKLKINAKKYPPELARGNALKYTDLSDQKS